jgi:mannosyl-oligosaccharide alpha-1,2-mannosidase
MHALLGGVDAVYKQLYTGSMSAAIKHTIYRPMTPDSADILVAGGARAQSESSAVLDPRGEHLVCFTGGMFALGGKLFDMPEHVEIGRKLTDGCIWSYKALPLGVMPEVFQMIPCKDKLHCTWNETLWHEEVRKYVSLGSDQDLDEYIKNTRIPKGFAQISDPRYILRPEAIESVFMMYRITGEEKYQDAAWDMFTSIIQSSETELANAALSDITYTREELKKGGFSIQMDSMESFWMAETLKYFYLIFSEPDIVSLDQWMFNTEAHPFKRNLQA